MGLCPPSDSFLFCPIHVPLYHPAQVHEQEARVRQQALPGESSTEIHTEKNARPERQPEKNNTGSAPSYFQMMDAVPLKT